jgi:hypothetical protein
MQQPVVSRAPPQTNMPLNPQTQALQENFNILESKEIQDNLVNTSSNEKARKQMLQKMAESGQIPTLQLKVLSSAHLEKDFTLLVNPMGIVPNQMQNTADGAQALGNYEAGPRRQEFDGYTFFGVEDGLRASDEDDS